MKRPAWSPNTSADAAPAGDESGPPDWGPAEEAASYVSTTVSVTFEGARQVTPVGLDQAETIHNYFVGDQSRWRSNVPTFETVAYEGLYDEVIVVAAPGAANPDLRSLAWERLPRPMYPLDLEVTWP